jgi:hypothetical protein
MPFFNEKRKKSNNYEQKSIKTSDFFRIAVNGTEIMRLPLTTESKDIMPDRHSAFNVYGMMVAGTRDE